MSIRTLIVTVLAFASTLSAALSDTIRPATGPVILARSGAQSTYLWDATPYVAQLMTDKNVGDAGLHTLEGTAVSVLHDKALSSHAKTLILRVVYTRSGAVSPIYGSLTFNGVEKLATFTASRNSAVKYGAAWSQEVIAGKIPHDLDVQITGKLPPPQ